MFIKQSYRFSLFKFLHEANLSHLLKSKEQVDLEAQHYPVMKNDVCKIVEEICKHKSRVNLLDCTIGTGGHAKFLLDSCSNLNIKGIDMDPKMIEKSAIKLQNYGERISMQQINFADVDGLSTFDVVFADLGYNMDQILDSSYGLSYRSQDTPLDMRYGGDGLTASDILNKFSQQELGEFFIKYGNLKQGPKLAQQIALSRQIKPIVTCGQLVELCRQMGLEHSIPQVFQTLRILVNQEIVCLQKLLMNTIKQRRELILLIITFHNLELDTVEEFTKKHRKRLKIQKVQYPSTEEVQENPRSRSAKLLSIQIKAL